MANILYNFGLPINHAKDDGEEDCELSAKLAMLLEQEQNEIQLHQEPVEVVNLGT